MRPLICLVVLATLTNYAAADCREQLPSNICVGHTGGVFLASPLDCSGWVQCHLDAIHACDFCPTGFYFDVARQACEYAALVKCSITEGDKYCTPGVINRVPNPESCSIYYQCPGEGNAIEHVCAAGTHFDEVAQRCDLIDNVRCLREPVVIECPATTELFTNEPHPWVCERFFTCVLGVPVEQTCVEGMHFDINLKQCQVIAQAQCIIPQTPEPEPPVDPTDPEVPPVDPTDPEVPPVDPTDPEVPPVDPTDPEVPPTDPEVPPVDPEVPPTDPEVPETEPEVDPEVPNPEELLRMLMEGPKSNKTKESDAIQCSEDITYYKTIYPDNCQKYIQCINGVANIMYCAEGTLFHPEDLRCDIPENVTCT